MIKRLVKNILLVLCAGVVLRACVGQSFQNSGLAMLPSLAPGDVILTSKIHYGLRLPGSGSLVFTWKNPSPGDVVVLTRVGEPPVSVVRRIVAVGGDKVKVERGTLMIKRGEDWQSQPCEAIEGRMEYCRERYGERVVLVRRPLGSDLVRGEAKEFEIKENEIFVLADDRRDGPDSRHFGVVPFESIVGVASRVMIRGRLAEELPVEQLLETKLADRGWLWPVR